MNRVFPPPVFNKKCSDWLLSYTKNNPPIKYRLHLHGRAVSVKDQPIIALDSGFVGIQVGFISRLNILQVNALRLRCSGPEGQIASG